MRTLSHPNRRVAVHAEDAEYRRILVASYPVVKLAPHFLAMFASAAVDVVYAEERQSGFPAALTFPPVGLHHLRLLLLMKYLPNSGMPFVSARADAVDHRSMIVASVRCCGWPPAIHTKSRLKPCVIFCFPRFGRCRRRVMRCHTPLLYHSFHPSLFEEASRK